MRRVIQEILDEWSWLTFTEGRFRVTRFCSDDLIAEVTVEDFLRNHSQEDRVPTGLMPQDIPDGTEAARFPNVSANEIALWSLIPAMVGLFGCAVIPFRFMRRVTSPVTTERAPPGRARHQATR
jgi:hypothetical protein